MELKYAKDTSKTNEDIEYKFGIWYPIKIAPKDGSCVIICYGEFITTAYYDKDFDFYGNDLLDHECKWTDNSIYSWERQELNYYNPTHWMPLPPNP